MDKSPDISTAEVNNFLVRRLGEKEASEIMNYINTEIEKQVAFKTDAVKTEIILWREEMARVFASKDAYEKMQTKLIRRVSGAESTLILWAFVFWITQIAAVYCILTFIK
jgi:hypothetical protein